MKEKIIETILPIIGNKGYSEMSISCIAEATKLKKSSLYHFFPGGKAQIGLEIVLFVDQNLSILFSKILQSEYSSLLKFHKSLDILSDFYKTGKQNCVLDIMTIPNKDDLIQEACANLLYKLINIFTFLLRPCYSNNDEAEAKAIELVTLIQGSLILSRVTKQNAFFSNCIHDLKNMFVVEPVT